VAQAAQEETAPQELEVTTVESQAQADQADQAEPSISEASPDKAMEIFQPRTAVAEPLLAREQTAVLAALAAPVVQAEVVAAETVREVPVVPEASSVRSMPEDLLATTHLPMYYLTLFTQPIMSPSPQALVALVELPLPELTEPSAA